MKIRVLWPGKTKSSHYRAAIEDYTQRIRKMADFEIVETRESSLVDAQSRRRKKEETQQLKSKRKASVCVLVDGSGKELTSEELAQLLQRSGFEIDFIVGGPAGLSQAGETLKLSLGKMTFPHELARVIVLEQIYRSLTILKRIPYHK